MNNKYMVFFKDIIKGEIIAGWTSTPHPPDKLDLIIRQWFRENEHLILRGKKYTYATFAECIRWVSLSNTENDIISTLFGEYMAEGVYGIFPVEVISGESAT